MDLKNLIKESLKNFSNYKEFIQNLPEPLKTKLRQNIVDDKNFTKSLYQLLDFAYDKLSTKEKLENFFIHFKAYKNAQPYEILDGIKKYLERAVISEARGSKNPNSKIEAQIKELEQKEKKYFDTYKTKATEMDKVKHLREMADVIEQIANLKKQLKS